MYERVVIVGVGLLGGSIGMALRNRSLARKVVGVGRRPDALNRGLELGAIDEAADITEACKNADLAIVCTPVQQVVGFVRQCDDLMAAGALITDVGSTKQTICNHNQLSSCASFCGSHPLAGSDKSGVEHADAHLFEGRLTIVTPTIATEPNLGKRTEQLWGALGSRTVQMSPEEHDKAVAQTSHLPHIVAAALAALTPDQLLPLAASGWCDTTRVAGGSAQLWAQILCENREPILAALQQYSLSLGQWSDALKTGDESQLETLLIAGKQKRDSLGN